MYCCWQWLLSKRRLKGFLLWTYTWELKLKWFFDASQLITDIEHTCINKTHLTFWWLLPYICYLSNHSWRFFTWWKSKSWRGDREGWNMAMAIVRGRSYEFTSCGWGMIGTLLFVYSLVGVTGRERVDHCCFNYSQILYFMLPCIISIPIRRYCFLLFHIMTKLLTMT